MGLTNYLLKGIILQVGPRVFFSKYGVACFKTQQNGSGGIFQKKTTWMSVRTLLGNSIGQIRSIWKLNYDILNVFVAVLVKHVIDNLKKKSLPLSTYIYIWHILHLAWISPKRYISPPSPKKIRRIIKVLLPISQVPNKEHSCQGGTSTYLSARRMKSALESWSPGGQIVRPSLRFDDTPQKSNKGVSENRVPPNHPF